MSTVQDMDTKMDATQDFSDWECICGYVNEGIDEDCLRCSRDRATGVAELNAKKEAELVAAQKAKLAELKQEAERAQARKQEQASVSGRLVGLEFHGRPAEFLGPFLLIMLFSFLSFGIYSFWGTARMLKWVVGNSTLGGRALQIRCTGLDVLVLYLLNGILCSITLGIYTPWAIANVTKWFNERVEFAEAAA